MSTVKPAVVISLQNDCSTNILDLPRLEAPKVVNVWRTDYVASIPRYSYEQIYLRETKIVIPKLNLPDELLAPGSGDKLYGPGSPGELPVTNEPEQQLAPQAQSIKPFRPWEI